MKKQAVDFELNDAPPEMRHDEASAWAGGANAVLEQVFSMDSVTSQAREELISWINSKKRNA